MKKSYFNPTTELIQLAAGEVMQHLDVASPADPGSAMVSYRVSK